MSIADPVVDSQTSSQMVSLNLNRHVVLLVETEVRVTDEIQSVDVSSCLSRSGEGQRSSRSPSNEA